MPLRALRRSGSLAIAGLLGLVLPAHGWTGSSYELTLRPNFETQTLSGTARIRLQPGDEPQGTLELLSPRLELRAARLAGSRVTPEKSSSGWRLVVPKEQSRAPTLELEVDYVAKASPGLVFGEAHVYTAFHTCRWMPCAGSDLSRATVSMDLEIPEGFQSVASGERVGEAKPHHTWRQGEPYPLYTFGFAAGRFTEITESVGSRQLRYLGVDQTASELRQKFRESASILAFLEDKAGLPLPHPTYTQVLVPGSVAQEASSFSLIGTRMLDPILDNPQEDWVIVHEMAHQWWGNLITCASWKELWLNEGITVFLTIAWKKHRWGEAAYQRELRLMRASWQRAREAGFDKPLSWKGHYPSLRVKRSIHYSKAALFFDALRGELGDELFWKGLREYTAAYLGKTVTAKDLQTAMEASAGQSLQDVFDDWVY